MWGVVLGCAMLEAPLLPACCWRRQAAESRGGGHAWHRPRCAQSLKAINISHDHCCYRIVYYLSLLLFVSFTGRVWACRSSQKVFMAPLFVRMLDPEGLPCTARRRFTLPSSSKTWSPCGLLVVGVAAGVTVGLHVVGTQVICRSLQIRSFPNPDRLHNLPMSNSFTRRFAALASAYYPTYQPQGLTPPLNRQTNPSR